uniref:Putative F-box family protein n=1 Tax=Davidia involucrata TaxID=16924 RepID=A0A5B7A5B8_DAVIN
MKKSKGVAAEGKENYFDRLPDGVVLLIFDKLSNVKWLCRCSMVSDRFASLIPLVQNISILIPCLCKSNSQEENHRNSKSAEEKNLISNVFTPRMVEFYGISSTSSALDFLWEFKQIRSLYIKLSSFSHEDHESSSLLKWKLAMSGNEIESFVCLIPTSLRRMKPSECKEVEGTKDAMILPSDEPTHRVRLAFRCLEDAFLRLSISLTLIANHEMLQSVEIGDSMKQGKLYVAGEQLVELRNFRNSITSSPKMNVKYCYVPVLHLR